MILRSTSAERFGAEARVAGLTVLERARRQLARQGHAVHLVEGEGPRAPELAGLPEVGADVVRCQRDPVDGGVRVIDESSRRRAEDAVFAELLRGDLGVVARYLNKPVSFRLTRHLLCRLPVTPNQVTLGAAFVGLIGCLLLATGDAVLGVAALGLAHLQSVLDGCDGELARVRFQQSALGEWLDTLADDALNLLLLGALSIGLARAGQPAWTSWVCGSGVALLAFYNVVTYRELVRQQQGGEVLKVRWWFARGRDLKGVVNQSGPFAFLIALGRRDFFILAWFLLSLAGLWQVIAVYAGVIALVSGMIAAGQLATRPRPARVLKS